MSEKDELYNINDLKVHRKDLEPEVYAVCDMCRKKIFYRPLTEEEKAEPNKKRFDSIAEYDRVWFHLEADYAGKEARALSHRDPEHLGDPHYILCPECGKSVRALFKASRRHK